MIRVTRRRVLKSLAAIAAAPEAVPGPAPAGGLPGPEVFAFDGAANIREENHFGIINQIATVGINYRDVTAVSGLFAPPFASSDFLLEMRLNGERVPTREYGWSPQEVWRRGTVTGIAVSTVAILAAGMRAGVVAVTLENTTEAEKPIPLLFSITGSVDYVKFWGFPRPDTAKKHAPAAAEAGLVVRGNEAGAFAVGSDLPGLVWEPWSSHWVGRVRLAPRERTTFHVSWSIGERAEVVASCGQLVANSREAISRARQSFAEKTRELFYKVPVLEASHTGLVKYYNRSLMHLLLNQWRVPQFVVNPCYSTGAIKGGCVGCYLWDYGLMAELLPLYDPQAVKAHIRQFLKIDITRPQVRPHTCFR